MIIDLMILVVLSVIGILLFMILDLMREIWDEVRDTDGRHQTRTLASDKIRSDNDKVQSNKQGKNKGVAEIT